MLNFRVAEPERRQGDAIIPMECRSWRLRLKAFPEQ
jgi:hypothetical protein